MLLQFRGISFLFLLALIARVSFVDIPSAWLILNMEQACLGPGSAASLMLLLSATDAVSGVCFNPSYSLDMLDGHCSIVRMSWPGLSPSLLFSMGSSSTIGPLRFHFCACCIDVLLSYVRILRFYFLWVV